MEIAENMNKFGHIEYILRGKEQQVIDSIRLIGITATMESLGLKNRRSFLAWLHKFTPEGLFYPSKIKGMSRGTKAKWLRNNRDFVLECMEIWGKDFVLENLNLGESTLEDLTRFSKGHFYELHNDKMNVQDFVSSEIVAEQENQKVRIDTLRSDVADLRKEIKELESLFGQFSEGVSKRISQALIMPLVQHLTAPDRELNLKPKNDLNLDDLFKT